MDTQAFVERWSASGASERANKDLFLSELCEVLGLERPRPATGDPGRDTYSFERQVAVPESDGRAHLKPIDLYKEGCFILEAKQGSERGSRKVGTARRGTPGWNFAMSDAFGQALGYAKGFDAPPPFIVVCDIGHCFDLYASFDGSWFYRPFPSARQNRLFLSDLERHASLLRALWTDPASLDPARKSQRVTREVAAHLAELARSLEAAGHAPEPIAKFLMRCIFTMFAEDIGLLPDRLFTDAIKKLWLPSPPAFLAGARALWKAMNEGGELMLAGKLLKFAGSLFAEQDALPLDQAQLRLLLEAAECEWSDVEPAIFGTLVERALDPVERHALGAHFTPKAYVERLVRPTIEEPLRSDFELVRAEVRQLVEAEEIEKARRVAREFHRRLCQVRVLDPACGSGNFLYVTLELFKRLEGEVLALLGSLGETQERLDMESVTVNPSQFLGIEIKPWAKEITDLVLWIGYLQWHFRTYATGDKKASIPEPVLRDYKNIECRDAVLEYDRKELLLDGSGKPVTRWDGVSMKKHPVTGEDVPDESKQKPLYRYVNPRKATWPKADFIVGNPPFVGNKRMRDALGDGYVEALRGVYDDVPDTIDYVMYWWEKAAVLVRAGEIRRFGFITTNSITQTFSRKVLQKHMEAKDPLSLVFAIPDHPWVDSESGAAVRIGMTVASPGKLEGTLLSVESENETDEDSVDVVFVAPRRGRIHSDLTAGADVARATPLCANAGLCWQGCKLVGAHFQVSAARRDELAGPRQDLRPLLPRYWAGRDITQSPTERYVVDLFGLSEEDAQREVPSLYQHLLDYVRPERAQNRDKLFREKWWLFGRPRPDLREANSGLSRYIVTSEVAKHRTFIFLSWPDDLIDGSVIGIALSDGFSLGLLSSRAHVSWSLAAGGTLEDRPRYQNGPCFDPFPFPVCDEETKGRIRELGEALDAHRKARQAEHPDLTITGMYNVLEKLRAGEALSAKEKAIHEKGLVSVLKKIHDDLDAAVFDAYGWPRDLTDEQILERLVALNAERAEEEKRGLIRWLRPEYQTKVVKVKGAAAQVAIDVGDDDDPADSRGHEGRGQDAAAGRNPARAGSKEAKARSGLAEGHPDRGLQSAAKGRAARPPWPKTLPEQIAAVRDLVLGSGGAWTAEAVARSFKHARASSAEPVLDSLAAIGVLVALDGEEGKQWKGAGK